MKNMDIDVGVQRVKWKVETLRKKDAITFFILKFLSCFIPHNVSTKKLTYSQHLQTELNMKPLCVY